MGIVGNIDVVIETGKIKSAHLPVNNQGSEDEKQAGGKRWISSRMNFYASFSGKIIKSMNATLGADFGALIVD